MNSIVHIENNSVTATATLPTACIIDGTSHAVQTLARWQELHPGEVWRECVTPNYDPATQREGAYVLGEVVTREVLAKSAEELAADVDATRKNGIRQISRAAKDAVENEANAALQDQLYANYKSATPHPMVVAVVNWGKSIYLEAEIRKGMVGAGMADDGDFAALCDFSAFGPKPHTVYQLYVAGLVDL